jgi:undecaprenyl-diphosphatase
VDVGIVQVLNDFVRAHALLAKIVVGFSSWGIVAFAAAVAALWLLDAGVGVTPMRRACGSAFVAATLGLVVDQLLFAAWPRSGPALSRPGGIVPLVTPSRDPSFPSNHTTVAFAIAFAVLFVSRRAGVVFIAWAVLIACSRVLVGVHYATDVLAGVVIGVGAATAAAYPARRLVLGLVRIAALISDPILQRIRSVRLVRDSIGSPQFRQFVVLTCGLLLLERFAIDLRDHLLDEMPVTAILGWALVVVVATGAAGRAGHHADPAA